MIKHYNGVLGTFDYDDEMFEVTEDSNGAEYFGAPEYLHYVGDGDGDSVVLPEGCINTNRMFYNCKLPKDFNLGDNFDTSNVRKMNCMFAGCALPKGFTLGDKFDTSSAEDMSHMFAGCQMPEGFNLGDKFNTSKVRTMYNMFGRLSGKTNRDFKYCTMSYDFTLGDKFDTSKVTNMSCMFIDCILP